MTWTDCPREPEVGAAVVAGGWPDAVEPSLRAHAETCRACREVAIVTAAVAGDGDEVSHLPTAPQVWWRLAVRARVDRERAAARPVIWLQGLAGACGIGLTLSAARAVWPEVQAVAGGWSNAVGDLLPVGAWAGLESGAPFSIIAVSAVAAAAMASAAVYLWIHAE